MSLLAPAAAIHQLTAAGAFSPTAPSGAKKDHRSLQVMKVVNRIFVAGALGFAPFVHFKGLRSSRPGTVYRLFRSQEQALY